MRTPCRARRRTLTLFRRSPKWALSMTRSPVASSLGLILTQTKMRHRETMTGSPSPSRRTSRTGGSLLSRRIHARTCSAGAPPQARWPRTSSWLSSRACRRAPREAPRVSPAELNFNLTLRCISKLSTRRPWRSFVSSKRSS